MADKHEKRKKWAQKELDKIMPYEKWVAIRERTDHEKKLYKESVSNLQKLASGEEKWYDKITITNKNGKTTVKKS